MQQIQSTMAASTAKPQSSASVASKMQHTLTIENKSKIIVTAVAEVVSATTRAVFVKLYDGTLTLSGEGLKVEKLSPEEHLLVVSGSLASAVYGTSVQKSFFKRLFK